MATHTERAQGTHVHVFLSRVPCNHIEIESLTRQGVKIHPAAGGNRVQPGAEMGLQAADHQLAALRVELAHLAYVTGHVAFADESGERILLQHRLMPVRDLCGGPDRAPGPGWSHDKAESDAGEKALREGAHIENRA